MHYDIHKTLRKFHVLLTRMRINANISFHMQNTVEMVLFFRAKLKVLFFNENQAEKDLKSFIFDHQNSVRTMLKRLRKF